MTARPPPRPVPPPALASSNSPSAASAANNSTNAAPPTSRSVASSSTSVAAADHQRSHRQQQQQYQDEPSISRTSATSTSSQSRSTPHSTSSPSSSSAASHTSAGTSTTASTPNATLSAALAAAAASTSASLFNLSELFDTVKMMSAGRVFTGYFANQSLMEPIKQDLFVFFDVSSRTSTSAPPPKPAVATPALASPTSASAAANSLALPVAATPSYGGALYWSVVNRGGTLHRTRSNDLSLALSSIEDIYLGKRTNAFTLPFAQNAKEECCFSLIAKNRTHMNFEAKNPVLLVSWLFGLKRLVQAYKKLCDPLPAVPVVPHPGSFLDLHDTNQTNLRSDIWNAILQGIHAGTVVFQQTLATPVPKQVSQQPAPAQSSKPNSSSATSAANSSSSSASASNNNTNSSQPTTTSSGGFLSKLLKKSPAPQNQSASASNNASATATSSNGKSSMNKQPSSSSTASPNASKAPSSTPSQVGSRIPTTVRSNSDDIDDDDDDYAIDPLDIFEILGRIGQGNYGYVYKARDTRDDSLVAIKMIEIDANMQDPTELEAEISILQRCKSKYIVSYRGTYTRSSGGDHTNTMATNSHLGGGNQYSHTSQQIWIVLEYCHAGSVCDLMAITDRILNETQIASILYMTLQGLAYFHSLNHIHRDIKGSNILINHEGIVKLSDFGISSPISSSPALSSSSLGSPYWISPEVLTSASSSKPYDARADIWSLAITAIEFATGDPPLHDMHPMKALLAIPTMPPPRLPQTLNNKPATWSKQFQDFVNICLVKDPAARPTAAALLTHPFIKQAMSNAEVVVRQLVTECIPEIEKYREIEARMANKVAFGSRLGRDDESDSELSVSRSRSSISRSYYNEYSTYGRGSMTGGMHRSAAPSMSLSGNGLGRAYNDRERMRWELESSRKHDGDGEYSQRSASPSFSSVNDGAYWHDRLERHDNGPTVAKQHRLGHSTSSFEEAQSASASASMSPEKPQHRGIPNSTGKLFRSIGSSSTIEKQGGRNTET